MAKFKHEITNRRALVMKREDLNINHGWKTLQNKYPTKCCVCDKYIGNGVKILWHTTERVVMHKEDCSNVDFAIKGRKYQIIT
jgi:hypothetical protein